MFTLVLTEEVVEVLRELAKKDQLKAKKVQRTFKRLQENPRHPGLHTHKYQGHTGPANEELWQSYIENRTPGAWRAWWFYGPDERQITVLLIGPHPD